MKKKYTIVIAEDHTILREGLRALLSSDSAFEVVKEAKDGREAIRYVDEVQPDAILMDLSMPRMNGLEAIEEIKKRSPEVKIVVLTVHKAEEYILSTLQAGANGYVLKDESHTELVKALNIVLHGRTYLSPEISGKIVKGYLEGKKNLEVTSALDNLTRREKEVLKLIAEGYKNKEVADYLFISLKTVEKHRSNLMKKLGLHNTASLTAYAIENGLITL